MKYVAALAVCVFALTGGLGLFCASVEGLSHCGDFMLNRLLLLVGGAILLAPYCFWLFGWRRALFALSVLALSVGINTGLGQDPLGAWLNWQVRHIEYDSINADTEAHGLFAISKGDWVTRTHDGRYVSSGSHFNEPWPRGQHPAG